MYVWFLCPLDILFYAKGRFCAVEAFFVCGDRCCAAVVLCCHAAVSADSIATAAPTASSSRNIRSEPITVNSTVADADTVNNAQTAAPTTEVTEAPAESEAEEVDTPATGDFPVPYLAAVLGLILVCSAGLVMLKRI